MASMENRQRRNVELVWRRRQKSKMQTPMLDAEMGSWRWGSRSGIVSAVRQRTEETMGLFKFCLQIRIIIYIIWINLLFFLNTKKLLCHGGCLTSILSSSRRSRFFYLSGFHEQTDAVWQISLAAEEFEDVDARWVRVVEGWGRHRVGDPHRQWTAETAGLLKLFYKNKDYKMNRGYFLFSVKLYRELYKQTLSLSWQIDLRYTLLQVVGGRFNVLTSGWRSLSLALNDVLCWIWNQVISKAPDYCNIYYKPQNLQRWVTQRLPERTYKLNSLVHRSGPPPANNHHKNKNPESVLSLVGL